MGFKRFSRHLLILAPLLMGLPLFGEGVFAKEVASCSLSSQNRFEELEAFLSPDIEGNYSDKVFRQTCALLYTDAQGKKQFCSTTLVKDRMILTAAHCDMPSGADVACYCGEKENLDGTKGPVFAYGQARTSVSHPEGVVGGAMIMGFDVRVAALTSKVSCPESFPKIELPLFPKSLAHAKQLITKGDCYFSGFGWDNENVLGNLHSVKVPKNYQFENNKMPEFIQLFPEIKDKPRTEWVSYISEVSLKNTVKFMRNAGKDSKLPQAKLDGIVKEITAETTPIFEKDPNKKNGTSHGDSGGSLFCLNDKKETYLVGVPVTDLQSVLLVNDPAVASWLKKQGL
jgi:hypothetical protein